MKFSGFSPIRAVSYNALPVKYQLEQSMLNIRNYKDPKCVFYCYRAVFHLLYGPPLVNDDATWQTSRCPHPYVPKNPWAYPPCGAHIMPIPVEETGMFESKNDVQI